MKNGTKAFLLIAGVFVTLVGLNLAFFVDSRENEENEQNGDRSSLKSTPYGTLAYYTLLEQSGLPVTHLERPYTSLKDAKDVSTLLVIAPPLAFNPSGEEFESLNTWIEKGGFLIVIDREISLRFGSDITGETVPGGVAETAHPLEPTSLVRGVRKIALSSYASHVRLDSRSTVLHLGDDEGAVLAESKVGNGRVMLLGDPYVVSNDGLSKEDNLVLALNLTANRPAGQVAFDEYHHGYGSHGFLGGGGVLGYFKGTPVPWMMFQIILVALLLVYSRGRRFARPLPLRRERRTTTLEFVGSMATISRLARASDLAMLNIYSEFRRRLCRFCNLPVSVETPELAAAVAHRAGFNERELKALLAKCEDVTRGREVTDVEILGLVTKVRDIEQALSL